MQSPYGVAVGGFWCVALLGRMVVWYNDMEHGFNISRYTTFGAIDEYHCNQDEMEDAVQSLLNLLQHG